MGLQNMDARCRCFGYGLIWRGATAPFFGMKTVKMQKGDKTADVHPSEVENMQLGGWEKIKTKRQSKAKAVKVDANN